MEPPLWEVTRLSEPRFRTARGLVREVGLVAGAAVTAILLCYLGTRLSLLTEAAASSALTVAAAALALATGAMWYVVQRTTGDTRAAFCAAAMGTYALLAIPLTILGSVVDVRGAVGLGRLTAYTVVAAFWLAASMPSAAHWRVGSKRLLVLALLAVFGAVVVGFVHPHGALAVSEAPELRWLVVAGWVIAGTRIVREAMRLGLAPGVRAGLGVILLATAHGYRVASEPAQPLGLPSQPFTTLRLVALVFIGVGAFQYVARTLKGMSEEHRRRLHAAASVGPGWTSLDPYQAALRAELARLSPSPPRDSDEGAPDETFEVGPIVRAAAAVQRAAGLDIRCEVADGLVARGSSEVLRQVLAHLLANCARHAPGSPVMVLAWASRERVVLRVSDEGPGVPVELRTDLFGRDASGSTSERRGLGLRLCRELLAAHGGSIRLHQAGSNRSGCTIQVELPAAVEPPTAVDLDRASDAERLDRAADGPEATAIADGQARWVTSLVDLAVHAAHRTTDLVRPRQPTRSAIRGGLLQVGSALGLLAGAMAVCYAQTICDWLESTEVRVGMALLTVAAGVLSAFSCAVLGQLRDEAPGLWLCAGLTFYSVIGIPVATFHAGSAAGQAALGNLRLLAHVMLVLLTFVAVFAAQRPRRDGWVVLGVGLALSVGVAALGVAFPAASLLVTTNEAVRYGVCACSLVSGVALLLSGCARGVSWLCSTGIGCTMIAIAHTLRVVVDSPLVPVSPMFSTIRLLGMLFVMVGVAYAARRALVEAYATRNQQHVELWQAQTGLQDFAEQQHEIRNSLAGLTNVTVLLESDVRQDVRQQDEWDALRKAVTAELARLSLLLSPPGSDGREARARSYDVRSVLEDRVALQTRAGMDVRADVEHALRAFGNPLVLSQVLANVLANCERHAPGSPVRIQAMRRGGMVVIQVRDFGPGIPAEVNGKAFEIGVRGPDSTGQGFGLNICRRLLEDESGRIYPKPRRSTGTGCTVVIEVPAPPPGDSGSEELAEAGSTG